MDVRELITECRRHEATLGAVRGWLMLRLTSTFQMQDATHRAIESVGKMPAGRIASDVSGAAEDLAALLDYSGELGRSVVEQAVYASEAVDVLEERRRAAAYAIGQAAEAMGALASALQTAHDETEMAGTMVHTYVETLSHSN